MSGLIDVQMEIHQDHNPRFMKEFVRYEPVDKDHTAIAAAKLCLRKYFYQVVLGFVPKTEVVYFAWGSAYHGFREILDKEYGYGAHTPRPFDADKAQHAAVLAIQAGDKIWRERGVDQPADSKLSYMTRPRLLETFKSAYEHWTIERKRGNIIVLAVEQPFVVELEDGIRTSGRIDRLERWLGKIWVRDYKASGKNPDWFSRSITPNDQATRYAYAAGLLAGEKVEGVVFEQMYNNNHTKNKKHGPAITAHTASRTEYELEQWKREEIQVRGIIDSCREVDVWPQYEAACSWCQFHSVCSRGQSEEAQMYQLKTNYIVRPWDNARIGYVDDEVK
jgi:RecB family exonuclease